MSPADDGAAARPGGRQRSAGVRWIGTLSARLRRGRFAHFRTLLSGLRPPIQILDVGGREAYWGQVHGFDLPGISITLLNREPVRVTHPAMTAVVGDGRDLRQFGSSAFDVVFSNSVIEHVGGLDDQARLAREIMRVGRRYYVQTPSRTFPIEPHFFLPYFQYYPDSLRIWVLRRLHLSLGDGGLTWQRGTPREVAVRLAHSVRLLNERELRSLFPGGRVWREKVLGLTKSLVIYGNWD